VLVRLRVVFDVILKSDGRINVKAIVLRCDFFLVVILVVCCTGIGMRYVRCLW
jgi:hypothetical protein